MYIRSSPFFPLALDKSNSFSRTESVTSCLFLHADEKKSMHFRYARSISSLFPARCGKAQSCSIVIWATILFYDSLHAWPKQKFSITLRHRVEAICNPLLWTVVPSPARYDMPKKNQCQHKWKSSSRTRGWAFHQPPRTTIRLLTLLHPSLLQIAGWETDALLDSAIELHCYVYVSRPNYIHFQIPASRSWFREYGIKIMIGGYWALSCARGGGEG